MQSPAEANEDKIRLMAESSSELDLRSAVLGAPIGICILNASTLVTEIVNQSFIEVAGKPYEEIAGKFYWDSFAEARPYYEAALNHVVEQGTTYYANEVELMLVRHGKEEHIYVTFVYAPLKDATGKVTKVAVWVLENTPQVIARQRVQEAEEKARLAIRSADLGLYEIVYATDIMTTDGRFKEIWGINKDTTKREEYLSAIHPEDLDIRQAAHAKALLSGQLDYQTRIVWKDRTVHWVRITGKVMYDDQVKPLKLIGVAQDITETVNAQKKIEESEKSIRTMILQAPVAMCILRGASYGVEIANNKMFELWGKKEHEMLGRPLFEGLPEAKKQGLEQLLDHVYATGETFKADERPVKLPRNGKIETVYVNFVYEALQKGNDSLQGILVVANDVTQQVFARRKIEEIVAERTRELAEVNSNLQRSNAELRQFAYIASHDLQEPIRKVSTYASILESYLPNAGEQAKKYLEKITTASDRMQALIRDVLSYSEVSNQVPRSEPVDLQALLGEIAIEFELLIEEKQASLRYDDLPTIEAVPLQMGQLFGNLVSNALKYTRAGVTPVIDITAVSEGPYCHIQVRDNGIGFSQAHAVQIFDIFQRLHRESEYSGTGIGLAMCKKIAQNHQGEIYAISQPGEGATFHILLPRRHSS